MAGTGIHIHPGAKLDVSVTGAGGSAGILTWHTAAGDLIQAGNVVGTTASALEGGDGSFVIASAGDSMVISGPINFQSGNNGVGYFSEFTATNITILPGGWIKAGSKGPEGSGGGLTFYADHVSIQDDLNISGGGDGTGAIEIRALLSATVSANLSAGASNGGYAGGVEVRACDVHIEDGAKLEAVSEEDGDVYLSGGRRLLVEGQLKAGFENDLGYDLNYPTILDRATTP